MGDNESSYVVLTSAPKSWAMKFKSPTISRCHRLRDRGSEARLRNRPQETQKIAQASPPWRRAAQ